MTTRRLGKERTRQKLIEATLKVLHRQGQGALTTGRIAEQAGVAQPTFYCHFRDMDDALTQASAMVGSTITARLEDKETHDESSAEDVVRDSLNAFASALLREPRFAELFLRHRRDGSTPLGHGWQLVLDRVRDELCEELASRGIRDVNVYVELSLGMVLSVVEGVLDKRISSRREALEQAIAMAVRSMPTRAVSSEIPMPEVRQPQTATEAVA